MKAHKRTRISWFSRGMEELSAILWLMALMFIVVSGARGATGVLLSHARRAPARAAVVLVKHGDCLWEIAERYRRPGEDSRRALHALCAANGIRPGRVLHPGDRLLVPYSEAPTHTQPETIVAARWSGTGDLTHSRNGAKDAE